MLFAKYNLIDPLSTHCIYGNTNRKQINYKLLPDRISSITFAAILSVTFKSSGSPEVHTQRNGPKPKEKTSLKESEN